MAVDNKEADIPERRNTGRTMEFSRRIGLLRNDKKVREAATAGIRTVLNAGIALSDLVPGGVGEVLDVIASIAKTVKRSEKNKEDPGKLTVDLTPDVGTAVNWVSQLPEFVTAGAFPSYAIPAGLQLFHDVPRMIEGGKQAIRIIKGEQEDYANNKQAIDEAISVFSPK